ALTMSSFALSPRSDPFLPAASLPSSAVATSEASSSASAAATRSVRQAATNPALSHCSCTTDSAYSSLYGPGQAAIHHQTIQQRRSIRSNADQASADLMLLPHCRTTSSFRGAYDLSPAMSETPELSGAAVVPSATAAASCTGAASMCSNANADKSSSSRTSELDGRIEQQREQLLMDSDNENENEDEHFN
uniref:Protein roadkill n=1 Tax=Macrostomum lignano TaxID=282301 RepID=A0A1I8J1A0_9PLAT